MNKYQNINSDDSTVTVTLTDRDVLFCPICLNYLTAPVYQCENGHVLCSPCCLKLKNKCPYCRKQSGSIRCRAIERVLESLKVPCRNKKYGCLETISFSEKHTHENKSCLSTPCSCPLHLCSFVGSTLELKTHFKTNHMDASLVTHFSYDQVCCFVCLRFGKKFHVFQEHQDGTLIVLDSTSMPTGNAFYVTQIGPGCSKRGLLYDLTERDGRDSISFQSQAEIVQEMVSKPLPPNKFLMVKKKPFFCASNVINLELCIWKSERLDFVDIDNN